jgi:imidazoleglycerol-phosphate dehydratase
MAEGTFKCVARALRMAVEINSRETGIPSTKGNL